MNWNNVNLEDNYERGQNIIDPLSFETLLLEVHCNIQDITIAAVRNQFEIDLQNRIKSARETFEANVKNITAKAKKEQ